MKEQIAELYAKSLAEKGFITLAFDAAYQRESEGTLRGLEEPSQRVEDIRAAAGFLTTINDVDAKNIGVLGICSSGGYSIVATATDHTINALVTVSGVDLGNWNKKGSDGKQDPKILSMQLRCLGKDREPGLPFSTAKRYVKWSTPPANCQQPEGDR